LKRRLPAAIHFSLRALFFLFLMAAPAFPESGRIAIPYPNGAVYLEKGLSGAFLGGKHRNLGENQSLYQWQGELGYLYVKWFSAGLGFKITAGEPSETEQKIFNRYFIFGRFHKGWDKVAVFAGPLLGVNNLNILTGSPTDSIFSDPINNTKPTLGLNSGVGWKFSRWVGLTVGSNLEYSLVDEEGVGLKNALNHHINPGLAVDILAFSKTMKELVPAFFVNVEFQFGLLIFEKERYRSDRTGVIGVGFAF